MSGTKQKKRKKNEVYMDCCTFASPFYEDRESEQSETATMIFP